MKTKYLTIRIGEDEKRLIKADAVKAGLSLTEYVLGKLNVPTIVPTQENVPTKDSKIVPMNKVVPTNVPTVAKGASVHTIKKELNKQLKGTPFTATVETSGLDTDYVSRKPSKSRVIEGLIHTCTGCHTPIKKGFLCADCLK